MNHKTNLSLAGMLLLTLFVNAQTVSRKDLPAKRTTQTVKIDGLITDAAWKDAALMTDLVEFRPKMGTVEPHDVRTEAYLMYNDEGIFFGGYCYERTKDSIARELSGRDGFGANDYIGVIFDTYFDKLNGFEYFVTPLNEQWDAKMSPGGDNNGGEDFSWNAVWKSGAVIHNDGWSFEMFIPYSAIRFGKKDIQNWGMNITRRRRKTEQQSTWNPIDINVNGFLTQEGLWTGITNIKPPLRLQFSPYFSTYVNHYPHNKSGVENTTTSFNGGMDVKYGINQAFTLDVTLIPDFGQVQSDPLVLNLTPFEVKYTENRPFFTEGTELFNKGNLFYSRRIGGTPMHLYDVYDPNVVGSDEKVIRNPTESKLINASKISGRTQKGLGIGFLNAITSPQHATIENVNTKEQWEYETNPLTNYNIFVLNQSLKHNSSVSLVNTNTWRSGPDYDANVTAGLFDFNDKKNMWNVGGKAAVSTLVGYEPNGDSKTGYSQQLYFGKISGRFNFNVSQELTDTKFSSNDLGYFTNNNFLDHNAWVGYRWTKPKGFYNRIGINFNFSLSHLFTPIGTIEEKYQRSNINFNGHVQTKKLLWFGSFWNYTPYQNDFYEPRTYGWFFRRGSSLSGGAWLETNYAKKYSAYFEAAARKYFNFYDQTAVDLLYNQNYRFSNKFSLSYRINYQPRFNNMGYTWSDPTQIIFGKRKVNTIENILGAKYNFNNMMGITLRIRHYYSSVDNKEFFTLQQDGSLVPNPSFATNKDQNANFFNVDMVYTWQFAPGSFINVVWKNAVYDYTNIVEPSYIKNLGNTIEADQNNNISLKVIYFLDYLQLKKKKTKS